MISINIFAKSRINTKETKPKQSQLSENYRKH